MINFLFVFIASDNSSNIDDVISELNPFTRRWKNIINVLILNLEHIKYIKNKIGIDHIGIGADFDGSLSLDGHK